MAHCTREFEQMCCNRGTILRLGSSKACCKIVEVVAVGDGGGGCIVDNSC